MIVASIGFVTKVEDWEGKENVEPSTQVHVALEETVVRVACPYGQGFPVKSDVLVCGELKVFEKRPYIRGGSIRAATEDDFALFAGAARAVSASVSGFTVNGAGGVSSSSAGTASSVLGDSSGVGDSVGAQKKARG